MAYPPSPRVLTSFGHGPWRSSKYCSSLLHLMAKYAAHCNPLSLPQLRLPCQPRVRLPGEQERHARLRLLLQEHRRHGGGRHLPVPARHIRSPTSEWKIWVCSRSISSCRLGVKLWFVHAGRKSEQFCWIILVVLVVRKTISYVFLHTPKNQFSLLLSRHPLPPSVTSPNFFSDSQNLLHDFLETANCFYETILTEIYCRPKSRKIRWEV